MRAAYLVAIIFAAGLVGGAIAAWLITTPRPAFARDAEAPLDGQGDPAKGKLMFAAGDCASCHASPGQSDRLRLGGGLALASPYGTFRAPNISMDPVDGIGSWRTVDLANALLSGVSPAGSHYYPAFPYPSYAKMGLGDVSDLMAYLRTLPAVAGKPPPHDLAFPFQIRRFVGFWKFLYLRSSTDRFRSRPRRGLEPRPILDGSGSALRRMSFVAEHLRRHQAQNPLRRRDGPGRGRIYSKHHANAHRRLETGRYRRSAQNRQ